MGTILLIFKQLGYIDEFIILLKIHVNTGPSITLQSYITFAELLSYPTDLFKFKLLTAEFICSTEICSTLKQTDVKYVVNCNYLPDMFEFAALNFPQTE